MSKDADRTPEDDQIHEHKGKIILKEAPRNKGYIVFQNEEYIGQVTPEPDGAAFSPYRKDLVYGVDSHNDLVNQIVALIKAGKIEPAD